MNESVLKQESSRKLEFNWSIKYLYKCLKKYSFQKWDILGILLEKLR